MRYLLPILLLATTAHAVDYTSEVCGDGIDNDNSGGSGWGASLLTHPAGDAACTGISDKDRDGYTTTDCDDTNRHIYPGAWTTSGCTGGQFRKCGTDGTYGSCTSTYTCEATNSKVCYYIDAVNGNDSNTGLSTAAAWKSFGPINDGCNSGTCHGPAAGEVFVVRAGTYNTNPYQNYCGNNNQVFCTRGNNGTASYPIWIRNYPGEEPLIASPNTSSQQGSQFLFYQTTDWRIEGLTFTGGYGNAITLDVGDVDGARFKILHNRFYGIRGYSGDNVGAISLGSAIDSEVTNNIIQDVQGENGGLTGSGVILFQGKGSRVHHNVIFNPDQAVRSQGVFYKHGETNGDGAVEIDHNILWGFQNTTNTVAISSGQRATHVHHNLILDSDGGGIHASCDNGGPGYLNGGWLVEYNTIVRSRVSLKENGWGVANCQQTGLVTWSNNVIVDDTATYSSDYPLVLFDVYGSDAAYSAFAGGTFSDTENNCFYSSGNAALTNAFCVMCGSPGTTGAFYNFNDYKTATGDANIYNENANLTTGTFLAQSTNCLNKGWDSPLGSGGVGAQGFSRSNNIFNFGN